MIDIEPEPIPSRLLTQAVNSAKREGNLGDHNNTKGEK
jgi:hypothetical protein